MISSAFWVPHSSLYCWFISGQLLKQEIPILRNATKFLMRQCHSSLLLQLLVLLVKHAFVSVNHAQLYLSKMHLYLRGLKAFFPDYSLHPNHHMALHLPKYLLLYGPVHSWWTFPFQQLIGILQHISTNYKIGRLYNLIFSSIIS